MSKSDIQQIIDALSALERKVDIKHDEVVDKLTRLDGKVEKLIPLIPFAKLTVGGGILAQFIINTSKFFLAVGAIGGVIWAIFKFGVLNIK